MKQVTEMDFRLPEFKDAKVEDYEFRGDGKIVRKDRWERGIRSIAYHLSRLDEYSISTRDFEIDELVDVVEQLVNKAIGPDLENL